MSEKNNSFVHLQCHTEFSLLEGALRIPKLVKEAANLQMPAVAITDNGTMYGTMDFYVKAKAAGLNPLIGCDMFLTPTITQKERSKHRLLFLCKSYKGYQNLIKLVSISHLDGFYYKPRIDLEHIKQFSEDLICISTGRRGPIASYLSSHQFDEAKHFAEQLLEIFGDDFYIGLQRANLPFEDLIISGSQQLSESLKIPLVALNDVFYQRRDLAYLRDVLFCIQTGKQLDADARNQSETQELYFKSPEEMHALFHDIPEACNNTLRIAEKCDINIETDQVLLPGFDCPDNLSSEEYLAQLVWEGIHKNYSDITDEIKERIKFELNIINKMHYANYFLITYDFLKFCYDNEIPVGPGRGSAAGSIVSYALNITKIDPIRYKLLFERFLNPERVSMPDVDIDFCIRRRSEVIEYIIQKYGQECVSQIITFGTMQPRAVVRDVGRVLNVPLSDVDRIAKLIPSTPGQNLSISEAIEQIDDLKKAYRQKEIKRLLDIGMELEGQARHSSTHAAGVVISRDPLTSVVPLVKNDGQVATQFAMADIEKIGLLKMDILGLRNLTVIQDTLNLIKKRHSITIDLDTLDIEDQASYDLLCAGKTVGVFQLESKGMRTLIKDLKPEIFEDIIALLALYRPGPLGSGMVNDFISNKSGKTITRYLLPETEPILKETYGMILYQEQVMQLASVIGGFSLGQADMLRRAMGKKKKSVMDEMRETFLSGAKEKNLSPSKSREIFELCYKFAEYGFNKSHSAAYAQISFQTAYLKANYPYEYMSSLLSSVLSNSEKTTLYVQECKDMGIDILPPSINHSFQDFTIEEGAIRFGLGAIKNVGEGAIQSIIDNRQDGPYKDIGDFCKRVELKQVNKRVIDSLVKSGAADELDEREKLLGIYEKVLERAVVMEREQRNGQVGLFGGSNSSEDFMMHSLDDSHFVMLTHHEKCRMQKDLIGLYLTGHPLDAVKEILDQMSFHSGNIKEENDGEVISITGLLTESRQLKTRTNKDMVIGTLEDLNGVITVLAFESPKFEEVSLQFRIDHIMTVKGKVKVKQDEISMMVEEILVHDQLDKLKSMFIDIEHLDAAETFPKIKKHCSQFRGTLPLYFKNGTQTVLAHKKYWINSSDECLDQLTALVGKGRHWIV
jgi:DNA polymerase III subunit alpha